MNQISIDAVKQIIFLFIKICHLNSVTFNPYFKANQHSIRSNYQVGKQVAQLLDDQRQA